MLNPLYVILNKVSDDCNKKAGITKTFKIK